jgi:hypothetical protein
VTLRARTLGDKNIIGQILLYPITCHPTLYPREKYSLQSMEDYATGLELTKDDMISFWGNPR